MKSFLLVSVLLFSLLFALLAGAGLTALAADPQTLLLKNAHVLRELAFDGHVWRTVRFARADGSVELKVQSDEFKLLFLDNKEATLDQYQIVGEPVLNGTQRVTIRYVPRTDATLPGVMITYALGNDLYPRKTIQLTMKEGQAIDRLEVERFSVAVPATRGGRGEPVFVGDQWWFGVEYPAFYSRHTDGNTPKWQGGPYDRMASFPSVINLDGRDVDQHSRPGLIRLMHFPGAARKLADGSWGIVSKSAVCGVRDPKLTMELSFTAYIATIRKPIRSFIHFNNWFDPTSKNLSVENFVNKTFIPMRDALAPYGVKINAMVPDHGWQNNASIYSPKSNHFPNGWTDVAKLNLALEKEGTRLGIWLSLNGYNSDTKWGADQGYRPAQRNSNFSRYGTYYALAEPKYNMALREAITHLLRDCRVNYFKHDFNNMCDLNPTGQPQTERHGHETEVDAVLELLAFERSLNPDVYLNMTNFIWFSPWWLQHCDTLWMLAGDDGLHLRQPDISTLAMSSLYRDVHLYKAWGLGVDRPLVPISSLMTHGIIYTKSRYGKVKDSIREFADYVMMYYVRGVNLKEWYFTPDIMNSDHWRAVGTITRWAEENHATLANAVLIGADPNSGNPFGYVSWDGDHGILAVRNTRPGESEISLPFDQSTLFRGEKGREFHAIVSYPYQAEWPGTFRSGEPMKLKVPGYSLLVMNLKPGTNKTPGNFSLPDIKWSGGRLTVPADPMQRCELLVYPSETNSSAEILVDGQAIKPSRFQKQFKANITCRVDAYDLLSYRGKDIQLTITEDAKTTDDTKETGVRESTEVWLVIDRAVPDQPANIDVRLPWPIAQGYRRQTMRLDIP
jgi:hypothetical protein